MWNQAQRKDSISLQKTSPGTSYEGVYQGNKVVKNDLGDSVLYQFMDEEEKPFSIWGFTNLNFQMESVPFGTTVKITYLGLAKKKGKYGKFPHQAKVEVWSEDGEIKSNLNANLDAEGKPIPF